MNITHNSIPILFPLPNDTNRKVYKPFLHFFSMKNGLTKLLGIGAIAAATAFMPMKANADATTLDYVNTVISEAGVDQDDTRDGIQLRYDWTFGNGDGQSGIYDALFKVGMDADLESKGMYGFKDQGPAAVWDYINGSTSYFDMEGRTDTPQILPGKERTFSAYINEADIIGNKMVDAWAYSNEGQTNILEAEVPITIPEPATLALVGLGGLLAWMERRRKQIKY